MSITLKQFDGAAVTPKDDALLYEHLIRHSGIFEGCGVIHLGGNQLQIAAGRGIIKGRIFVITQETVMATVSDSGTKRGRLLIEVDIENISSPIIIKTQMAAALPTLIQEDINHNGTVYQMALYEYDISAVAISNGTSVAPQLPSMRAADNITIADVGDYFAGSDAESALQEIGAKLDKTDHVVGALFTRSSNQAITAATETLVQWNYYSYNPDNSHNAGDLTKMYCRDTGIYTISFHIAFQASIDTHYTKSMVLLKNGAAIYQETGRIVPDAFNNPYTVKMRHVIDNLALAEGDYLQMKITDGDPAATYFPTTGYPDSRNYYPVLSMRRNRF